MMEISPAGTRPEGTSSIHAGFPVSSVDALSCPATTVHIQSDRLRLVPIRYDSLRFVMIRYDSPCIVIPGREAIQHGCSGLQVMGGQSCEVCGDAAGGDRRAPSICAIQVRHSYGERRMPRIDASSRRRRQLDNREQPDDALQGEQ